MNIELGTIRSSPFVGVFAVLTDKVCLLPKAMEAKEKKRMERLLGGEILYAQLANSNLLGVLAVGNSRGFLVSDIVEEKEVEDLRKSGIRIKKVPGITALGNLVECNDSIALCSKIIPEKQRKIIEKELGTESTALGVAESDLVGSNLVLTNRGFVANPLVSEKEFKKIEEKTGLVGTTATANYGDRFVGNSIIAKSDSAMAGIYTTGHELIRIDEGLSGR